MEMSEQEYDDVDMDAFRRAWEIACRDQGRKQQLESMVNGGAHPGDKSRPWAEVAKFAAYCVQGRALNLKPWETPPCHARAGDGPPMELLDRMLEAGISQWEPDSLGALKRAFKTVEDAKRS
jgi:hypothetical protein